MKKYYYEDTKLCNGIYETLMIKAEDEEEALGLLAEKHINMGKGAITPGFAKERYILSSVIED